MQLSFDLVKETPLIEKSTNLIFIEDEAKSWSLSTRLGSR